MSYSFHNFELTITNDLLIYELVALHEYLSDMDYRTIKVVNLVQLTEMDFATAQYFLFLKHSCPEPLTWMWPRNERLAAILETVGLMTCTLGVTELEYESTTK